MPLEPLGNPLVNPQDNLFAPKPEFARPTLGETDQIRQGYRDRLETLAIDREGKQQANQMLDQARLQREGQNVDVGILAAEQVETEQQSSDHSNRIPVPEGMNLLFDGETFLGWRPQNEGHYGGGRFTIEEGAIVSDPEHPGMLYTTGQFADIVLDFEFQAEPDTDAMLLFRTSPEPKSLANSCYALVLSSSSESRFPGTLLGRQDAPTIDGELGVPLSYFEKDKWYKIRVVANDRLIKISFDGRFDIDYIDTRRLGRGYIGFLVTKGQARFRNISWVPLRSVPLFQGENLDYWKSETPTDVQTSLEDWVLRLTGGPGMLESKDLYDNFVLELEYQTGREGTNSGVFFRCIPEEKMNGYECQILANPTETDREKYKGCDTGGLFRLKDARSVGSKDNEWNSLVLLAVDNYFQTWVNGYPVMCYFDRRPAEPVPQPNPRKGLRLEKGTLQLQGHDAGTLIDFRNIYLSPIPQR